MPPKTRDRDAHAHQQATRIPAARWIGFVPQQPTGAKPDRCCMVFHLFVTIAKQTKRLAATQATSGSNSVWCDSSSAGRTRCFDNLQQCHHCMMGLDDNREIMMMLLSTHQAS